MKKETLHIIGNEFTRGIPHPVEWWEHRVKIWEHFTLASLKNQTNRNFILSMLVDDYMPVHLRDRVHDLLMKSGLNFVSCHTKNKYATALAGLTTAYKNVLHTRMDSDDLFHKDVVEEIQQHHYEGRFAFIYQKGFCYDCVNQKLQHYTMPSPPFFTVGFPMDIYSDLSKWREYLDIQGHDTVINRMPSHMLSENKYIVLVHGGNLDTVYDERKDGEVIPAELYDYILQPFGITTKTYSEI